MSIIRRLALFGLAIILGLSSASAVLASDVSGSLFYGNITITNNSTATANISTIVSINTTNLQTLGYLNSSANNCVIRNTSGADVTFMPGYTPGGYPWSIFVPSIGANTYQTNILYTAESSGGDIGWFPGTNGGTVTDNAPLEIGDNFTTTVNAYVNTDNGTDKLIMSKGTSTFDPFSLFVSDTVSGNITARIGAGTSANISSFNTVDTYAAIYTPNYAGQQFVTQNEFVVNSVNLTLREIGGGANGTLNVRVVSTQVDGTPDTTDVISTGSRAAWGITGASNDYSVNLTPFLMSVNTTYSVYGWTTDGNAGSCIGWDQDAAGGTFPYWGLYSSDAGATWTLFGPGANRFESELKGYLLTQVSATGVSTGEHETKVTEKPVIYLDGVDDRAIIPNSASLNINSGVLTIEQWINSNWTMAHGFANGYIVNKGGFYQTYCFKDGANRRVSFYITTSTGSYSGTTEDLNGLGLVGEDFLATCVYNGSRIYIYINGVDRTSGTPAATGTISDSSATSLYVGTDNVTLRDYDGYLSDIRIYTRALSATEALEHYQGIYTNESNLVAYWPVSENTNTNGLHDIVNNNNGPISNNPVWSDWLRLYIDNTLEDAAHGTISVPDNANDWQIGSASATPYLGNAGFNSTIASIAIDGSTVSSWEWEYNSVFSDQSGGGNTLTPTFRTASSDPDVSGVLSSFYPASEAKAPIYSLGTTNYLPDTYTSNISAAFSTTSGNVSFPLANIINVISEAGTNPTPSQLPKLIIMAFTIIAASLSVSYFFRRFGTGSLVGKTMVIVALMGIFLAIGGFGIDLWMIFLVILISVAVMFLSMHKSTS